MKKIFIDTETTGLNVYSNCIWQLAFIIEIDGVEKERLNLKTNVISDSRIDPEALKIGNITEEEIKEFPSAHATLSKFKATLKKYINPYKKQDKMFFIGYNAYFDMNFLRTFFSRQGDKYMGSWFWYPPLDVMILAMEKLKEERESMKDFKQGTVAKKMGIEVEESKLHDAMYDTEIAKQIYERLNNEG